MDSSVNSVLRSISKSLINFFILINLESVLILFSLFYVIINIIMKCLMNNQANQYVFPLIVVFCMPAVICNLFRYFSAVIGCILKCVLISVVVNLRGVAFKALYIAVRYT